MNQTLQPIDYARLGDDSSDLIIAFDADFRYTYVNPPVERLIGKTIDQFLGRTMAEFAPHSVGTLYARHYERALRERVLIEFEEYYPPLDRWNRVRCVPQPNGGLIVFARNTTEEHRAEQALQESEMRTRRAARILDIVSDAYLTLDTAFRIGYANSAALRLHRDMTEISLGRTYWEVWPAMVGTGVQEALCTAMTSRLPVRLTYYEAGANASWGVWLDIQAYPDEEDGGLHLVYRDITDRIVRERREQFLANLTERTRSLLEPDALVWEAVSSVGMFLHAARCTYVEVDEEAGTLTVRRDWACTGMASIAGILPLSTFSESLRSTLRAGEPLVVACVDGGSLPDTDQAAFLAHGIRSLVNIPICKDGRWVGTLAVNDTIRRQWEPEDIELLSVVAERTWLAVENARLFREARQRAERESFLSEASHLLNTTLDYDVTLATIARLAVPRFADWCAVDVLSEDGTALECVAVEHADPAKAAWGWDIRHRYPTRRDAATGIGLVLRTGKSQYIPHVTEEMIATQIPDDEFRTIMQGMGFRSLIIVPLAARGTLFGALTLVATEESGRRFTEDDMRLAEEIGRRAGLALENTRLFQQLQQAEARQRHIADTLQRSLLFTSSADAFPWLEVDPHYEAASEEAFIGGDYGDAFRLDTERVAILVGDCTGKGLDAARFVGECQFTARAFLRSHPDDPAQALSDLNRMLLDGQRFDGRPDNALTCLIVAIINGRTGETLIAAGGAEPALVVRANTGRAEEIKARGPLLGMSGEAQFATVRVTLDPDDLLVLTTDGTTEARNRQTREFFGYDRLMETAEEVARSVQGLPGSAQEIVRRVKRFAGGALTDDACVLVAAGVGKTLPRLPNDR